MRALRACCIARRAHGAWRAWVLKYSWVTRLSLTCRKTGASESYLLKWETRKGSGGRRGSPHLRELLALQSVGDGGDAVVHVRPPALEPNPAARALNPLGGGAACDQSEGGVQFAWLAQEMRVCPCIHVGMQL